MDRNADCEPTTGSLTVSTSRMMLVPPRRFSRILISLLIFFFLTGWIHGRNKQPKRKREIKRRSVRAWHKRITHQEVRAETFACVLFLTSWTCWVWLRLPCWCCSHQHPSVNLTQWLGGRWLRFNNRQIFDGKVALTLHLANYYNNSNTHASPAS